MGGIPWDNTDGDFALRHNFKMAYDYELGVNKIDKTFNAKIGLMYVSEYYYSTSPENWINGKYYVQNWMLMGGFEWTISPESNTTDIAMYINSSGYMNGYHPVYYKYSVRPTFSLTSDVELLNGNGTKANPYRIKI